MAVRRLGSVVRRTLVIDTDGGVDDAIAVLVAVASPEVDLRAVTTGYGNVSVAQATENALRVLALAGAHHIPVAAGAAHPLTGRWAPREGSPHGPNGLGCVELPPANRSAEAAPAVDLLAELLRSSPRPVTVCALGPLTNIAQLISTQAEAAARIERLVVMGGAYGASNVVPTAEFNVSSDPEAAQCVLSSGLPITMVGLDVTRQTAMGAAAVQRIGASGPVGSAAAGMLVHHLDSHTHVQDGVRVVIHDALAVLDAITPGLLGTVERQVSVDCGHGAGRGTTLVDSRRVGPGSGLGAAHADNPMPVRVAETVDVPRALAEIETRLRSYGP